MGTIRAWLRDDVETSPLADRPTRFDPVPVTTDEDPPLDPAAQVNPVLTVALRTRTGFDDDGVPQFAWNDLVTGIAILWQGREEFDAEAGLTLVKATATMLFGGTEQVTESCMVTRDDDGTRFRVLAVRQIPGSLGFDLERIH